MCENTDLLKEIENNKHAICTKKSGVQNGKLYSQYEGYLNSSPYNITQMFGTDGGSVFKSRSTVAL